MSFTQLAGCYTSLSCIQVNSIISQLHNVFSFTHSLTHPLPHSLGITNYNLLGHFSSLSLLNHFWLVLSYNALFFLLTIVILFKKATQSVFLEVTYLLREKLKIFKLPRFLKRKKKLQWSCCRAIHCCKLVIMIELQLKSMIICLVRIKTRSSETNS